MPISLPHLPYWAAIAFVPLFMFIGRDIGQANAPLRRSSADVVGTLIGGVLGAFTLGPYWAVVGAAFCLWRSTGYFGAMDPYRAGPIMVAATRYALWGGLAIIPAFTGGPWTALAIALALAGLFCLALRIRFGLEAHDNKVSGDPEASIERAEGAAFGAAIFAYAAYCALVVTPG